VIEGPDEYIRLADASELTVTIRAPVKEVIEEPQLIEPDYREQSQTTPRTQSNCVGGDNPSKAGQSPG